MAAKRKPKSSKKSKTVSKTSLSKLSNKRLNRLAKQGRLKGKLKGNHNQYVKLLKSRIRGPADPETVQEEKNDEIQEKQSDIPLEEADYEYFSTPGRDFSFISDVSDGEESKTEAGHKIRRRKSKVTEEDSLETEYQQMSKRTTSEKRFKPLLPIKTKDGIVPRALKIEEEEEVSENEEDEQEGAQEEVVPLKKDLPPLSTAQLFQQRHKKLQEKKMKIAMLATTITENPEESTRMLRELREMLNEDDPDIFITVKKIVIVSLTEIFKDIIPAYRIRELTAKEKGQAVKKDTKELRVFEESLLNNYKHFLEFLEIIIKGKPQKGRIDEKKKKKYSSAVFPHDAVMPMRLLALRCLGDLLATHPHFNFRTNIIATIAPYMNSNNNEVSDTVCSTVSKIFREDKSGEVTLEIVRLIGRVAKARRYNVQPKMLATLLSLKIKEVDRSHHENKEERRAKKALMSRRELKRKKQMENLKRELQEAAVETDKQKKLRVHTEVVNMIFLTYFRILKVGRTSILLATVLEGLAKFAHLINLEFFDDLFAVLNELVSSGDLTYRESFHCIQTAFTILSGQGSALNIDPIRFYRNLYTSLFKLHVGITGQDLPIALTCLDIMINKRKRQVSQQRLLGFIKRLTTLALQVWSNGSLAILGMVRSFLHVDQKTDLLYDRDFVGSGVYLPELEDPEHCNAANTSLYELHLLRHHYHPTVQKYANHLIGRAQSQGPGQLPQELARKTPIELYDNYDPSEMTFVPAIPSKPKGKKKCVYKTGFVQEEVAAQVSQVLGSEHDTELSHGAGHLSNGHGGVDSTGHGPSKKRKIQINRLKSKMKKHN